MNPDANSGADAGDFSAGSLLAKARRFLPALKKWWWVPILSGTVVGAGMALHLAQQPPPTYATTSQMWVSGKVKIMEGGISAYSDEFGTFYGTTKALLESPLITSRAHAHVQSRRPEIPPCRVDVEVSPIPRTSIFRLEAAGSSALYIRAFLDALMAEYLLYKKEIREQSSDSTVASITEQATRIEKDLKVEQDNMNEFLKDNNLVELQEKNVGAQNYLSSLETRLADSRMTYSLMDELGLEATIVQQNSTRPGEPTGPSATISTINPELSQETLAKSRTLELKQLDLKELSLTHRPAHPKRIKLEAEIASLESEVDIWKRQTAEQRSAKKQGISQQILKYEDMIKEVGGKALQYNRKIVEYERLKQGVERVQRLYDQLSTMVRNVDVNRHFEQENMSILEPAAPAYAPPRTRRIKVLTAGMAGFIAGLGLVFLTSWFDDRVASVSDLRAKFNELVVGQIPDVSDGELENIALLKIDDERHSFAESYRNLRSSLLFMAMDGVRPKTLLITSAIPDEGKSTIAANLACTIAFAGSRVLLIEGDQRRGRLFEIFGVRSAPGLSELIEEGRPYADMIVPTQLPNLFFMPRGTITPKPGELFLNPRMDAFLKQVYTQFDHIIIDSAPVLAADDTTSLAPKVDGVLMVVRSGFTSAKLTRQSLDLLYQRQVRVLGLVYNRASISATDYNYYQYAEYYQPTSSTS